MKTIKFQVTQEMIDKKNHNCKRCPVAESILEKLKDKLGVLVFSDGFSVLSPHGTHIYFSFRYMVAGTVNQLHQWKPVSEWINIYDIKNGKESKPFTWEFEFSEEIVEECFV